VSTFTDTIYPMIRAGKGTTGVLARLASRSAEFARAASGAAYDYYRGLQAVHSVRSGPTPRADRYAAAKPTRLGQGWTPVTHNVNTLVTTQAGIIRNRTRQLVRDFPFFARAANVMVNYTVGTGITYQPRIIDMSTQAKGRRPLHKILNQQLEDAWNYWADEADLEGKQHLYDMMRLAKRQDVETGEFLAVLVRTKTPNRYLPIGIRFYESEWLTSDGARGEDGRPLFDASGGTIPPDGRSILGGVEFDTSTGEVLAYHLSDPDWVKRPPVRVPARYVIHGHEVLRPAQKRGISPFATAILVAHDLSEIMNNELDASQMASKWLAFVTTPDASGFQALRSQNVPGTDGTQKKIEYVENAILEYLRPGEQINMASSDRPGANFEPFVRLILRMVAVTTHTSYEILSGDYSGLSYSNLKAIRNDMLEDFDPIISRHVFQLCKPVHRWFMDTLFLAGKVPMPGYELNSAPYMRAYWQPAGHRSIDPLRDGKANTEAMKSLTMSPQEITRERGRDLGDVLSEISDAKAIAEEMGLDLFELLGLVSTARANNPDALGAGEDDGDGGQKGAKVVCLKK